MEIINLFIHVLSFRPLDQRQRNRPNFLIRTSRNLATLFVFTSKKADNYFNCPNRFPCAIRSAIFGDSVRKQGNSYKNDTEMVEIGELFDGTIPVNGFSTREPLTNCYRCWN